MIKETFEVTLYDIDTYKEKGRHAHLSFEEATRIVESLLGESGIMKLDMVRWENGKIEYRERHMEIRCGGRLPPWPRKESESANLPSQPSPAVRPGIV